jgi:hypothetical protein
MAIDVIDGGNIEPRALEDEMKSAYLDYAMSVIVGRALPDVRDGLKPVHRRVLFGMNGLGLQPNRAYSKCAKIVGEVMGNYHPHGDSAIYDTLVRMAQDFSLRYPLVDGQGNFGSIDDDPAAAMRYTEARLAPIAREMLRDLDSETGRLRPELRRLAARAARPAARFPNLLVNGSAGIAVRVDHGNEAVTFLEESQILDEQILSVEELVELVSQADPEGEPFDTEVVSSTDGVIFVKSVERKTGLARTHRLRRSLFDAPEYRQLARVHGELVKLAGKPPFTVKLGNETDEALSFENLRRAVLNVAGKGISLNRFKGLGEMNADQLRETTMDPATRTLAQVTMDDAATADRIFTMLMGDKVEPRREFIEENARLVTNLDV